MVRAPLRSGSSVFRQPIETHDGAGPRVLQSTHRPGTLKASSTAVGVLCAYPPKTTASTCGRPPAWVIVATRVVDGCAAIGRQATSRQPGASWSVHVCGSRGKAHHAMIRSNGADAGWPVAPSATWQVTPVTPR
ncbi:hypothetical protein Ato02nite_062210 [Paractinoplanes toevensis]|uniref:Uncharacterized protein n=1 Tax=Paractinoplanes toevensis TaxID=571911 RepID=A0A919W778_9ACTN|nr:hypothetical protein Ato02nite_062210 [Actinoplanes toevensis]